MKDRIDTARAWLTSRERVYFSPPFWYTFGLLNAAYTLGHSIGTELPLPLLVIPGVALWIFFSLLLTVLRDLHKSSILVRQWRDEIEAADRAQAQRRLDRLEERRQS